MQELVTEQVESPGAEPPVRAVVHRTKPEITTKELAEAYPLYVTVDRGAFRVRLFET